MGGSPSTETEPLADDGLGSEAQGDAPQEETPETEVTPEPEPDSGAVQVAQLARENAELRGIVDEVYDRMRQDPELAKRLGSSGTPQEDSAYEHFERTVSDETSGLKPEAAKLMLKALGPTLKRLDGLVQENAQLRSQVSGVARSVGSTEFTGRLASLGIPKEVQESKPFQRMLSELRGTRDYKRLEGGSATFAAEVAGNRWIADRARQGAWRTQRAVADTAKTGRNGSAPSRGASTAEKIVELVRDGTQVERADELRVAAAKAGKPLPKIVFVNKKS